MGFKSRSRSSSYRAGECRVPLYVKSALMRQLITFLQTYAHQKSNARTPATAAHPRCSRAAIQAQRTAMRTKVGELPLGGYSPQQVPCLSPDIHPESGVRARQPPQRAPPCACLCAWLWLMTDVRSYSLLTISRMFCASLLTGSVERRNT